MALTDAITGSPRLRSWARRLAGAVQLNQLVRAAPVLDLVREAGGTELLDAGSGTTGLAPWLRGWTVTALDASFDDYGAASGPADATDGVRFVVGDVRKLPFADDSFDVVVALDLLEHLAPDDRTRAVAELCRVARRRVIVACPAGAPALAADRRLAATLRAVPPWLDEHLVNGFPEPADLTAWLAPHGRVGSMPNERADRHVTLVRRELSIAWFAPLRATAQALSWALRGSAGTRAVAGRLLRALRGGDAEPTYRTIAWVDIGA